MISRALSVLRLVPNSKTKLTPFEAYFGGEVNIALRNLTKKPSLQELNWKIVFKHKLQCLDEASGLLEVELNLDWEKRSDLVYAPDNRKTSRVLEVHELAEAEMELTHPKEPEWLKRHKTSTTGFYQRTGKTDPKDPRRYKCLSSNIEKLTPDTVQMKKGSLLRRSGVWFRSAAEESRLEKGNDTKTPGPSKPREPISKSTEENAGTLKKRTKQ